MFNQLRKFACFCLLTLFHLQTHAQVRKYSNEFLAIGAGARGFSMGGAQVASAADATAGYWNPAGLTSVKDHPSVSLMHAAYFSGIGKYDFAGVALPASDNRKTLGISFIRFGVDDIPNTLFLVEPDGSLNYNNIRSFSSADYALLVSYAQLLKDDENSSLSVGGNAKIIYRKVGKFANAWGVGLDAAVQYRKDRLRLGAMVRDVSTTYNVWRFNFTDEEKERLYLTNNEIPVKSSEVTLPKLIIGAAYKFPISEKFTLMPEINADLTFDGKRNAIISSDVLSVDPHLGLELSYRDNFFFRAGVANFQQALKDGDTTNQKKVWIYQPAVGVGVRIQNALIDYAFSNLANQDNPLYSHIISLKLNFEKRKK